MRTGILLQPIYPTRIWLQLHGVEISTAILQALSCKPLPPQPAHPNPPPPQAANPKPGTPKLQTPNLEPQTANPKPQSPNPKSQTPNVRPLAVQVLDSRLDLCVISPANYSKILVADNNAFLCFRWRVKHGIRKPSWPLAAESLRCHSRLTVILRRGCHHHCLAGDPLRSRFSFLLLPASPHGRMLRWELNPV